MLGDNGAVTPSHAEVHDQLERILSSGLFAQSERLSRFLRYAVERTCAGEGDRLKEFVIGTEVLDETISTIPGWTQSFGSRPDGCARSSTRTTRRRVRTTLF